MNSTLRDANVDLFYFMQVKKKNTRCHSVYICDWKSCALEIVTSVYTMLQVYIQCLIRPKEVCVLYNVPVVTRYVCTLLHLHCEFDHTQCHVIHNTVNCP